MDISHIVLDLTARGNKGLEEYGVSCDTSPKTDTVPLETRETVRRTLITYTQYNYFC